MEAIVPQLRDSVSRSQLRILRNDKRGCKLKYFSLITDYLDLYENIPLGLIIVLLFVLIPKVEGNPKLKIGGGGFMVEASDLPIFASLQEDSQWTPYFSVDVEFPLASWLAFKINGSLTADVDFRTDPTTAFTLPNVRYAKPNTRYDTSLYFISSNIKFIHEITTNFIISGFVGTTYLNAELTGHGGAFPESFSDGSLTYNLDINLNYKLNEIYSLSLSSKFLGETEIERGVEVKGFGLKAEYNYRW